MKIENTLSRIIRPCLLFASNIAVFLTPLSCVMLVFLASSISQRDGIWWAKWITTAISLILLIVQLVTQPRFYQLLKSSFETAYKNLDFVAAHNTSTPLVFYLLVSVAVSLYYHVPASRVTLVIIFVCMFTCDAICVALLLRYASHWRHLVNEEVLGRVCTNIVYEFTQTPRSQRAFECYTALKKLRHHYVPLGFICNVNTETGEAQAGIIAVSLEDSSKKIFFADGKVQDVNNAVDEKLS